MKTKLFFLIMFLTSISSFADQIQMSCNRCISIHRGPSRAPGINNLLTVEYDKMTLQLIILYQAESQEFSYTIYNTEGGVCIYNDSVFEENVPIIISTDGLEQGSYILELTIGSYLYKGYFDIVK